jgi:phage terminase large subunit GpA-like protein
MPLYGLANAADIVRDAARAVFTVEETPTVEAFANAHYKTVVGEMKGSAWSTDTVPYARGIFEALADPSVTEVTLLKASQLGGTAIIHAWLLWMIAHKPEDTLLVMPSTEKMREFKKLRLGPTLLACKPVRKKLRGEDEKLEGLTIAFDRMNLQILGSNSKGRIEGQPYRFVMVDELDRCVPEIREVVRERVKTFSSSKIVYCGTPGMADVGIHFSFNCGTQERWHVPCPNCKAYHHRVWRNTRWEGGKEAAAETVAHSAWYVCPHCRKKITADHNRAQQSRGVWVPKGCGVKHDGTLVVPEGVTLNTAHRSFALHGLDNALVANPYGKVAAPFVDSGCQRTMVWTTDTVGEPWRPAAMKLEVAALKELCAKAGHVRGEVPRDVIALAAGVDVQTDRMYGLIVGFAPGGESVYLINYAEIPLDHGARDPMVGLDRWIDGRKWLKQGSTCTLPVMVEAVDSGDSTDMVYRSCRGRGMIKTRSGPMLRRQPVKGSAAITNPWTKRKLDETSKAGGAGLELVHVNATYWTDNVLRQLGLGGVGMEGEGTGDLALGTSESQDSEDAASSEPSAECPVPSASRLVFCRDCDEEFLNHFVNEQAKVMVRGGVRKVVWELTSADAPNHYLDAMKYAWCVADARGIRVAGQTAKKPVSQPAESKEDESRAAEAVQAGTRNGSSERSNSFAKWLLKRD